MAICDQSMLPLSQLEVLVIDCQATAAAPRGHLLEIAWARSRTTVTHTRAHLIALSKDENIPPAVARITGISEPMMRDGADAYLVWRELADDAARLTAQPAPTVIHFARFEQPFLRTLAGGDPPLDIVCTHDIARRLFPDLPRRSLRALAGYWATVSVRCAVAPTTSRPRRSFGRNWCIGSRKRESRHGARFANGWAHRSIRGSVHVESGRCHGRCACHSPRMPVSTACFARMATSCTSARRRRSTIGSTATFESSTAWTSERSNCYRRLVGSRYDVTATPLEAALLETDEIKRHRPPYNLALTVDERAIWFASPNLGDRSPRPSPPCPLGPLVSVEMLDRFGALARADHASLPSGRRGPDAATFHAGYERLCATHRELSRLDLSPHARLLRLGTRLWREGRRDRDVDDDQDATETDHGAGGWTPELVRVSLEWVALRAALARRRAMWLTRLVDASLVWREPGAARARLMVVEGGEIVVCTDALPDESPPIPPGYQRSVMARRELFTVACFDRFRVLTTELKRLAAAGTPVALRFGSGPALVDARLAAALWWV